MRHSFCKGLLLSTLLLGTVINTALAGDTTLQRIRHDGVLHAATEPAFEPFEFLQDGQVVGYGNDILHEVARRMGVRLDQQSMSFDAILPGLLAGKFDLAATSLIPSPERQKKFAFTHAIAEQMPVMVTYFDNIHINSKYDFSDKKIGVQQSSALIPDIQALDRRLVAEHNAPLKAIVNFQSFPDITLALINKQIDATIMPLPMALNLIKKNPGKLKVVAPWTFERHDATSGGAGFAWAMRKDDADLKACIDNLLDQMAQDGTLSTLQTKWFGKPFSDVTGTPSAQ